MEKIVAVLLIAALAGLSGCKTAGGNTVAERQASTQNMRQDALDEWYREVPDAEAKMEQAVGYGVFNSMATALLIWGSANGYGVVTNKSTNEETYMRAFTASAGLGFGIKDYRVVILFYDENVLDRFVTKGWDFGGEAGAEIASQGEKQSATGVGSVQRAMEIYEFTREGVFVRAAIKATNAWPVKDLNQ